MKTGLCILGCGNFARIFARSVEPLREDLNLYFASRALPKAQEYNKIFNGSGAFGSYIEAVSNPEVNCVYICTPHYLPLFYVRLIVLGLF